MQLKLPSHGQINWIQFLGFKKFDPVLSKLWQFANLVPRAIFKKYFLFRLPLITKRCAGVEVDNLQHQFSGNVKEVWYFPGIEFKGTLICCKFVENDIFIKFLMTLFTAWCKVTLPGTFRFPCYRLYAQTSSTSTNPGTSSISSTSGTSKLFISPVDAGRHLNIYATSRHRLDVLQNFQIVSRVYWVENFMLF